MVCLLCALILVFVVKRLHQNWLHRRPLLVGSMTIEKFRIARQLFFMFWSLNSNRKSIKLINVKKNCVVLCRVLLGCSQGIWVNPLQLDAFDWGANNFSMLIGCFPHGRPWYYYWAWGRRGNGKSELVPPRVQSFLRSRSHLRGNFPTRAGALS